MHNHIQLIKGISEISHTYKNYFFDLDGVLWRGEQSLPGALDALNLLRKEDKKLFFITNSSVRSRVQLKKRFDRYGFDVELNQCYPTTYFSGLYIKQYHPQIKNIICFGTKGLEQQLKESGLKVRRITQLPKYQAPIDIIKENPLDQSVQGIVVGWDPQITFSKICLIGFYLQRGAKFFGTNPDKHTMVGGFKIPGCGSILASIQTATGIKPEIIGKPNTFILQKLIKQHQLQRQQCIMIGDNLNTDICFGNTAHIATYCVLTGVAKQDDVKNSQGLIRPIYYSQNLTSQE